MGDIESMRRRFVVLALFAPSQAGASFARARWPAHVTLAPNFTTTAPLEAIEAAVFGGTLTSSPLVVRFQTTAWFGPNDEIPVQLVQHIPVSGAHRHLADRLSILKDFAEEEPSGWRDGYRPHLTLSPDVTAEEGERRRVHSVAIVELVDHVAVIEAVRRVDDLTALDRIDMQVALPVDTAPEGVEVVQGGGDAEFPTDITVETADGLRIETSRQIGIRWRSFGWAGPESTLTTAARFAAHRALMQQVAAGRPLDDPQHFEETAEREAQRLGSLLRDTDTWSVGPIDVDGVQFALFTMKLVGGIAAVADLGSLHISITGPELPEHFALQLIPASRLDRAW